MQRAVCRPTSVLQRSSPRGCSSLRSRFQLERNRDFPVTCITGDGPSNLVDQLQEQVTPRVAERLHAELIGTSKMCFNQSPAAIIINAGVEAMVISIDILMVVIWNAVGDLVSIDTIQKIGPRDPCERI